MEMREERRNEVDGEDGRRMGMRRNGGRGQHAVEGVLRGK
jgi:hypothetical protein